MIGQRTLFEVIDEAVATKPEQIWLRFFESSDALRQGQLRTVTFADLDTAINALAWWIHDNLGSASDDSTFCYIGPSDIVYYLLAFAANKCGWKVGQPPG
jgi:acyl-CoA synthetase (AMP-forming)/AMP-acid ligase II